MKSVSLRISSLALSLGAIQSVATAQPDGSGAPLSSQRPTTIAKPVALPWRDIAWPSLDYHRTPIAGGGALYSLLGQSGRKFRIDAVFEIGAYTLPQTKRPLLNAAMDTSCLAARASVVLRRFRITRRRADSK